MTTYCVTCFHWRQVEPITGLCQAADEPEDSFYDAQPELRFRYEGIECARHVPNGLPEPSPEETGVLLTLEDDRREQGEYREKVAERLRAYAKRHVETISQNQLAEKLNVSRAGLQGWLYRYPPTIQDCDAIMSFLDEREQE